MYFNDEQIISLYREGLGIYKISKIVKIPHTQIYKILQKNHVILRGKGGKKYFCNETFFEKIDSEEKAYWLGFLYADGYNKTPQFIRIALSEKDKDILEKFKLSLCATHPIIHTLYTNTNLNKKHKSIYIKITSKKISLDLDAKGCTNNKSLTLKFPAFNIVPNHLIKHFVRGYFDGDGGISFGKNGDYTVTICCGNYEFGLELQKIIFKNTGIKYHLSKHMTIFRLTLHRKKENLEFLRWLYNDAKIFLNRKYAILNKIEQEKLYLFKDSPKKDKKTGRFLKK